MTARWGDDRRGPTWWQPAPPRRDVSGGVAVPRPGQVSWEGARSLVRDLEREVASSGILSRARTYARAGQVVSIRVQPQEITAEVQGSADEPYHVALRPVMISGSQRTDASCDCPYGCDYGWCKHAAALAYVAAHLLETDLAARATWLGEEAAPAAGPSGTPIPPALLDRLLIPVPDGDPARMLALAADVVPLPAALGGMPGDPDPQDADLDLGQADG